ncbi:MAG: biosynthetic-type acetolactate synthase large subunit [Pseudomonadota bacterium]
MNTLSAQSTAADYLVQSLQAEGVTHVFGYPGGAALPVYDALNRNSAVEHVLVRHEQSAAHAADGYSRSSGRVGVCLVSSGPGVTNALTGIATAFMDSIPMVVLTGQVPSHMVGQDAFQEVDALGVTRPCVKHSFRLSDPDKIEEIIKKAFFLARTGRPGPVLVDLPRDMSAAKMTRPFSYPQEIKIRGYNTGANVSHRQIARAALALSAARRPLIYYGGGVVQGEASAALGELALASGAPVTSTLMGLGAFPTTHPAYLGMLGMHGLYEANMAMQNCDVLVAVGARFDDRVIGAPKDFMRPQRTIIHIDIDPSSISKRVNVHIPIVGNCASALENLTEHLTALEPNPERMAPWLAQIEEWRGVRCLDYAKSPKIKPQYVIELLSRMAGAQDFIVTSDVGQHQMWAAQYFKFTKPRNWINSGGLGTMGFGLPAAIGAAMANPGKTVVCITGDGSIQMSTKELSTCLQYRLPIKIICLNNNFLGMVKQQQEFYHENRRSQSYMDSIPDFVGLAEAYGHRGLRADNSNDLPAVLAEAMSDTGNLVFVDLLIDRTENVFPTLAGDQPLTSMRLRPQIVSEEL